MTALRMISPSTIPPINDRTIVQKSPISYRILSSNAEVWRTPRPQTLRE